MSEKMYAAKAKEAEQEMKNGRKAYECSSPTSIPNRTTRTLTRWKPDWELGVTHFERAMQCYKTAKAPAQALDAALLLAECHTAAENPFHAGKALEQASGFAKELGQIEQAVDLWKRASLSYRMFNDPVDAASCLAKAAKVLSDSDGPGSIDLLMDALTLFEEEDKWAYSGDTFRATTAALCRASRWEDCVSVFRREMAMFTKPDQLAKFNLSCVILQLRAGDTVAAERTYNEALQVVPDFVHSHESKCAHAFLDAFEKRDGEALKAAQKMQTVTFLENEVARVAKQLQAPEDDGVGPIGETETDEGRQELLGAKEEPEPVAEPSKEDMDDIM